MSSVTHLHNVSLEQIMSGALEEHDEMVSIGDRNITNPWFADDIDALAEEEQELEGLVENLDKTCTRYKMEISAEKTKLMINSVNGIQREIKMKEQTSEQLFQMMVQSQGLSQGLYTAETNLEEITTYLLDHFNIFLYACESQT